MTKKKQTYILKFGKYGIHSELDYPSEPPSDLVKNLKRLGYKPRVTKRKRW